MNKQKKQQSEMMDCMSQVTRLSEWSECDLKLVIFGVSTLFTGYLTIGICVDAKIEFKGLAALLLGSMVVQMLERIV